MDILSASLDALIAADPAYERAEQAYEGTLPEVFASPRLQSLLSHTGSRYRCNYAATVVDVMRERTIVDAVTHPTAQALIDTIYADNEMGFEIADLHRNAFVYGDGYAIVWPDDTVPSGVAIYSHTPRSVRVFYDPQRPRVRTHAVQVWDEDGATRLNLYTPDAVERYISEDVNTPLGDAAWVEYAPEEGGSFAVPNPMPGRLPVFHFRTQRPYGVPEHRDAIGPQEMINKIIITMMASIDYAGFPQRYVLTESSLNPTPEDDFGPLPEDTLDDAAAYRTPSGRKGQFDASPGATWLLGGANMKVGQFAAAQSDNFLKPVHSLIQSLAAVTDTPMHYFDLAGDRPSGESLRASEAPLNAKAEHRQASFGAEWAALFDYALAIRGAAPGSQVVWRPVAQADSKDFWEQAQLKRGLGVPDEVLLQEAGYTTATIEGWSAAAQEPSPEVG